MNIEQLKGQLKDHTDKRRRIQDQVVLMQKKEEILSIKIEQLQREISEIEKS